MAVQWYIEGNFTDRVGITLEDGTYIEATLARYPEGLTLIMVSWEGGEPYKIESEPLRPDQTNPLT